MTLDAFTFVIQNRQGEAIALAVVCLEARYASLRRVGDQRIERLHPTPAEWKAFETDLKALGISGLSPARLAFLAPGNEGHAAQWLHSLSVEVEQPQAVAVELDNLLRSQAAQLRQQLRMRQE